MGERELIKIIINTIVNHSVPMTGFSISVKTVGINKDVLLATREALIKYSPERAKFLKKSLSISIPELNTTIGELVKDYEPAFAMYGITTRNGFPLYNDLFIAWETDRGYFI